MRVYPRVCGGAYRRPIPMICPMGLSPRVRGSRLSVVVIRRAVGSIPACAGEPAAALRSLRPSWVYPRVCGGAALPITVTSLAKGLSPRVRGSRQKIVRRPRARGSIPACAGEPRRRRTPACSGRVYPRVCGGAFPVALALMGQQGLSPRVRGSLCQIFDKGAALFSI